MSIEYIYNKGSRWQHARKFENLNCKQSTNFWIEFWFIHSQPIESDKLDSEFTSLNFPDPRVCIFCHDSYCMRSVLRVLAIIKGLNFESNPGSQKKLNDSVDIIKWSLNFASWEEVFWAWTRETQHNKKKMGVQERPRNGKHSGWPRTGRFRILVSEVYSSVLRLLITYIVV